jgi:hypothetical protein
MDKWKLGEKGVIVNKKYTLNSKKGQKTQSQAVWIEVERVHWENTVWQNWSGIYLGMVTE